MRGDASAKPDRGVRELPNIMLQQHLGKLGQLRRVPVVLCARNKVPDTDADIDERMLGNPSAEPGTDVLKLPDILLALGKLGQLRHDVPRLLHYQRDQDARAVANIVEQLHGLLADADSEPDLHELPFLMLA